MADLSPDAQMAAAMDPQGWAGGLDGMAPPPERILNQDEIDNLLGFDGGDDDDADRTGIRAIINSGLVSYERLVFYRER